MIDFEKKPKMIEIRYIYIWIIIDFMFVGNNGRVGNS